MFSGIFSKPTVDIVIDDSLNQKHKRFKLRDGHGEKVELPTFSNGNNVCGKIDVNLNAIKDFEHKGIKLELIGLLESVPASSSSLMTKGDSFVLITLMSELEPAGVLRSTITTWPFKFTEVELKNETYRGTLKNVRYLIRVTIEAKLKTLTYEKEFGVINYEPSTVIDHNNPFKLEIGVEDWLLLFFHIDKMSFTLKDSIIGSVLFKNIGIKLKTMELHIIQREMLLIDNNPNSNLNDNSNSLNNKVMAKYQIMDGGPAKNETVQIRFPLKTYLLTPSYPSIANKYSVQYFMNIVLIDIEDRKYTKQHEIFMHRIDKKQ